MTPTQATNDTVYRRMGSLRQFYCQGNPSVHAVGGNVDVYISNNTTKPTDNTSMYKLMTVNAGTVSGISVMSQWVLFSGAGTAYEIGVIDPLTSVSFA